MLKEYYYNQSKDKGIAFFFKKTDIDPSPEVPMYSTVSQWMLTQYPNSHLEAHPDSTKPEFKEGIGIVKELKAKKLETWTYLLIIG